MPPYVLYKTLLRLRLLRRYTDIDWRRVERLVFVCSGNICRSPYAELKARSLGRAATSFGLAADGRSPAHAVASRIAVRHGLDLSTHRCRASSAWEPRSGDLLAAMEPSHAAALQRYLHPGVQLTLLGAWSKPTRPYIQDPHGLSEEYFETCFDCIDSGVTELDRLLTAAKAGVAG